MTNPFFTKPDDLAAETKARSIDINALSSAVNAGFDAVSGMKVESSGPPASPLLLAEWFDSDTGRHYTYVQTTSGYAWVEIAAAIIVDDYGLTYSLIGATTAAQAQNTTQYLGINGGQVDAGKTSFLVPETGTVFDFHVAVDVTPAAGQTYTFNLQKNGSTIGTITITNGNTSDTVAIGTTVTQYDTIAIQSVFSATSGSASVHYAIKLKA